LLLASVFLDKLLPDFMHFPQFVPRSVEHSNQCGLVPSPRAFSSEWADVAASIEMPDVTFHALRHTHASQLIDAGGDVVTISKRLGHSSPAITLKVYAHLFRQRDDKAAATINAALANLGTIG
jgi:integrase